MNAWRDKVLLTNKVFRRDLLIQEQTFEIQLRYLDLSARLGGRAFKAQAAGMLLMPVQTPFGAGVAPLGLATWLPPLIAKDWDNPKAVLIAKGWDNPLLGGPFDRFDEEGKPLIDEPARKQLLQRLFPALFASPPPDAALRQPPEGAMRQPSPGQQP
jgi:hypothetical protein